ncbi:hypothetical protein IT402_02145 [Candidatus Nomurabacteria bacterium]|nr:hypothetical protein [Candidatus Nomurabacteria bacterium]
MKKIKESIKNFLEDTAWIFYTAGTIGICHVLVVYTPLIKVIQGIHHL